VELGELNVEEGCFPCRGTSSGPVVPCGCAYSLLCPVEGSPALFLRGFYNVVTYVTTLFRSHATVSNA